MCVSLGLHAVILYVPFLADIFSIVPLSLNECLLVLAYSLPVVLIDEVMRGAAHAGGVKTAVKAGRGQAGLALPLSSPAHHNAQAVLLCRCSSSLVATW